MWRRKKELKWKTQFLTLMLFIGLIAVLAGCGDNDHHTSLTSGGENITIEGAAVDPPIIGADVYVCNATVASCNASTAIVTGKTGGFGKYSVDLPDTYSPPFVIKVEGGEEDTNGDNVGDKTNNATLYSFIYDSNYNATTKKVVAHATPVTTMIYAIVKSKNATNNSTEIENAQNMVKEILGLNSTDYKDIDLLKTPPSPALLDKDSLGQYNATIFYRAICESVGSNLIDFGKDSILNNSTAIEQALDELDGVEKLTLTLNATDGLEKEIDYLKSKFEVQNVENATDIINNIPTLTITNPLKIPNKITLTASPKEVVLLESDNSKTVNFTAKVLNFYGDPISNATVTLKCSKLDYEQTKKTDVNGAVSFSYNATKGNLGIFTFKASSGSHSATLKITVTQDQPPSVKNIEKTLKTNDTITIKLSEFATDNDQSNLEIVDVKPDSNNLNWNTTTLTYTAPNEVTTESFNCTVQDSYGQKKTAVITFKVVENPAPEITLSKDNISVNEEDTYNVTVNATDDDGINQINATSSNSSVAEVEPSSSMDSSVTLKITGVKEGTAIITVTATDNLGASASKTINVTVNKKPPTPNSIEISPNGASLTTGEQKTFVVKVMSSLNEPVPNTTVSFTTTGGNINPATGTTNSTGEVEVTYTAPDTEGNYTITAKVGEIQQTINVVVKKGETIPDGAIKYTIKESDNVNDICYNQDNVTVYKVTDNANGITIAYIPVIHDPSNSSKTIIVKKNNEVILTISPDDSYNGEKFYIEDNGKVYSVKYDTNVPSDEIELTLD